MYIHYWELLASNYESYVIKIMQYTPKNLKFTKSQKLKTSNKIHNSNFIGLTKGSIGLKALKRGSLSSVQLTSFKQMLEKSTKKLGFIFFNVFPSIPMSAKALKTRMGRGKGGVDKYIIKIKPGTVLFEIETLSVNVAKKAFLLLQKKIPFETKIILEKKNYGI